MAGGGLLPLVRRQTDRRTRRISADGISRTAENLKGRNGSDPNRRRCYFDCKLDSLAPFVYYLSLARGSGPYPRIPRLAVSQFSTARVLFASEKPQAFCDSTSRDFSMMEVYDA